MKRRFAMTVLIVLGLYAALSSKEATATTYFTETVDAHDCVPLNTGGGTLYTTSGYMGNSSVNGWLNMACPLPTNSSAAGSVGVYYTSSSTGGVLATVCSINGAGSGTCGTTVGFNNGPGFGVLYPSVTGYNTSQSNIIYLQLSYENGGAMNVVSNYYVTLAVQ